MNSVVDASRSCRKLLNTRMWPSLENAERAFSSNCVDNGFELLLVSQFTLFGRVRNIFSVLCRLTQHAPIQGMSSAQMLNHSLHNVGFCTACYSSHCFMSAAQRKQAGLQPSNVTKFGNVPPLRETYRVLTFRYLPHKVDLGMCTKSVWDNRTAFCRSTFISFRCCQINGCTTGGGSHMPLE